MIRLSATVLALLPLASCPDGIAGYNPLLGGRDDPADGEIVLELPPGTENPTPDAGIERYEEEGDGSGFAEAISWNGTTFEVDNLAFDGDNIYQLDTNAALQALGIAEFYEGDVFFNDSVTGTPIWQFDYEAIAAVSTSGETRFAIVRTGQYIDYGFGGFMYARNSGIQMPTNGQAGFTGDYQAIRDFTGRGGMEYVTGDADAAIDFEDFNDGDAVRLRVTNRRFYDETGVEITAAVAAAMEDGLIPVLRTRIGPGQIDDNGEIVADMFSTFTTTEGNEEEFETGKFYGLVAGAGANMELVGVLVVEATDPRYEDAFGASDVTVRETGGIIAYR